MNIDYLTEWFLYFLLFIFSMIYMLSVTNENIKKFKNDLVVTSGITITPLKKKEIKSA